MHEVAIRARLVRVLQDAHAGELAAAYAYQGHRKSLRRPEERAELRRIEDAEWHHRALVGAMLAELGSGPRRRREQLMHVIGRFSGALCFVGGWFGPMYAAGRLEASNVGQYDVARSAVLSLGLTSYAEQLAEMTAEERRHEEWFGDRVRGHWLLPLASRVGGWRPPDPGTGPGQ
ncbi:MAG TPA: demethoxyubiquinone hydroxylase family protein [Mycobacteriales bacterium]|nr:demethoxyubiquinone hydroxylase family protein [Mycobacteriales bacterium]